MIRYIATLLLLASLVLPLASSRAEAQTAFGPLVENAAPALLSQAERRLLQLQLAFEGDYNGLQDGNWGERSQAALASYSRREFGSDPLNLHLVALVVAFAERMDKDGWTLRWLPDYDISLLFPARSAYREPASGSFENWAQRGSSLNYSLARTDRQRATRFHDFVAGEHAGPAAPYQLRRQSLLVTTTERADGGILYARSDRVNGQWTTVMLSAAGAEKNLVHAVAGSIAPTRQAPIALPQEGRLARLVARFLDMAEEEPRKPRESEPPVPPDMSREEPGVASASGSGFVITRDGDVLTNAHVVDGCRRIEVDGTPGSIVAESEIFDLAILNARDLRDRVPAQFASQPAGLNADVTTAGYPLSDILDGLNVTRGSVSALKGLRGDAFNMQITAPVQPGSSGGPVFDRFGHVVGVVVARLDKRLAEERTGAMPENVNFAVRGEAAKLFLAQQGVQIEIVSGTTELPPEDLGRRAQRVTVRVTCLE